MAKCPELSLNAIFSTPSGGLIPPIGNFEIYIRSCPGDKLMKVCLAGWTVCFVYEVALGCGR
jgi:hypothetical protein